jgi:glucokinase
MKNLVLGIDLGGTRTKFGVVFPEGRVSDQGSITTCDNDDPLHFLDRLIPELKVIIEKHGGVNSFRGVGIGAPNGNFYSGQIEHAPNLKWKGVVPMAYLIHERLGLPTKLTNDANAAALGELKYGGAHGMKHFLMITLGTGLGGGVVVDGHLVYGKSGFAGELGHIIVAPQGRDCGCGRKGCLETYASATGLIKTYKELSGRELGAEEISVAALKGDSQALEALDRTAEILGTALANMAVVTSPQAIFLFGGLANAGALLFDKTKKTMEDQMLNVFQHTVELRHSTLPAGDAAILGAAAVVG